jgi:hypothetical protein
MLQHYYGMEGARREDFLRALDLTPHVVNRPNTTLRFSITFQQTSSCYRRSTWLIFAKSMR